LRSSTSSAADERRTHARRVGAALAGLGLAAGLSACTHTRALVLASPSHLNAPETPVPDLSNRDVTVALHDGFRIDAQDVRFTGDELSWRRAGTRERHVTRTADVSALTVRSHLQGALDGLLIGVAIGAPGGALLTDTPHGGGGHGKAALAGALSWGTLSAIVGAVKGSRIVYRVEAPPRPVQQQHESVPVLRQY
jgi:hypothetical protein